MVSSVDLCCCEKQQDEQQLHVLGWDEQLPRTHRCLASVEQQMASTAVLDIKYLAVLSLICMATCTTPA
jgi:hypothetical protein